MCKPSEYTGEKDFLTIQKANKHSKGDGVDLEIKKIFLKPLKTLQSANKKQEEVAEKEIEETKVQKQEANVKPAEEEKIQNKDEPETSLKKFITSNRNKIETTNLLLGPQQDVIQKKEKDEDLKNSENHDSEEMHLLRQLVSDIKELKDDKQVILLYSISQLIYQ